MTRKETILATCKDAMADLLYYDRKEDEDLPVGAIEAAIREGEISVGEIALVMGRELGLALAEE